MMSLNPGCFLGQPVKQLLGWGCGEIERALVIGPKRQPVAAALESRGSKAFKRSVY